MIDYALAVLGGPARTECRRFLQLMTDPGDPAHGKISGYAYGCRCPRCRAARLEYDRRRRDGKHA